MTRVVFEHSPSLFSIDVTEEEVFPNSVPGEDGATYYRAETKPHYVLYRRAVSGWGGLRNDGGGRQIPDPRQR